MPARLPEAGRLPASAGRLGLGERGIELAVKPRLLGNEAVQLGLGASALVAAHDAARQLGAQFLDLVVDSHWLFLR